MDEPDSTYAPQSPDLSAYHSSYAVPEQQQTPPSYYPLHQQPPYQQQQQQYLLQQQQPSPYGYPQFDNQTPQQPSYHDSPSAMPVKNGQTKNEHNDGNWAPGSGPSTGKGRRSKKAKLEQEDYGAGGKLAPGVEEGIEVKTKFPVARIKRIMQADEDVGKVAQVTPTAVSKALELFMISVVTKAANEAKAKSSKRVTAAHLKAAVQKDEQLDFLAEIISKVPDAPAPKAKEEAAADSEEGGGGGGGGVEAGKKKKAARRRKREGEE